MARISAYSAVTTLQDTDQFIIARSSTSENFSMTVASLRQKGFINTDLGTQSYILGLDSAGKVIKFASASLGNVYQNTVLVDGATVNWDISNKTVSTALLDTTRTALTLNITNLNEGTHHTLFVRKQSSSVLTITTGGQIYKVGSTSTGNTITLNGVAYTLFKIDFNKIAGSVGTTVNVESVIEDGNKGDITVANQNTWTINNSAVTDAKILSVSWSKVTGAPLFELQSNKGIAGGYASLDGSGKVPSSQLPSFVDDVVEYSTLSAFPVTGETGIIYVALDTNKIYRWSGSTYIEIASGSGIVSGSNTQIQFNDLGTFGADSTFTFDKTLNVLGLESIDFSITPTAATAERRLLWDNDEGSLNLTLKGGLTNIALGAEVVIMCYNSEATTLNKGEVVYLFGSQGQRPAVKRASNTAESTSSKTFGMVTESIASGATGFVMQIGIVRNVDTSAYNEGDTLYLGSTAGSITTTKPLAPAHMVFVGVILKKNASSGRIFVKPTNGFELYEIHDVALSSVTNNDFLVYESSSTLWKNKSLNTVLGYSPEQPLTFTSPLSRSTNTISIPVATSLVDGYLSSIDWALFNGKQSALSGTGIVKSTSGTISYINGTINQFVKGDGSLDSTTYAVDSGVVHISGTETITGQKTFDNYDLKVIKNLVLEGDTVNRALLFKADHAGYYTANYAGYISAFATGVQTLALLSGNTTGGSYKQFSFYFGGLSDGIGRTYTMPDANGTLALTSDIPTLSTLGGVPSTRTLTINGVSYDLSADRSWTISAGLTGTGTSGRIPKFTSSTSIGDSNISDNGTEISTLIPLYVSGDVYNNSFRATQAGISTTKTWLGVSTLTTSAVNLNPATSTATITANNNYIAVAILDTTVTEAASGNHNLVASLAIKPITLANAGATASNGATVYIEDAVSGTFSSGTYALWVDNGTVRLDGALELQTIPAKSTETNVLYYDTGTKRVAYGTVSAGTGTVTNVSVVTANGISGTVANSTTNAAITLTLGAITPTTVNGLTFTAAATGFTIDGGTTSKTLTVSNTLTLAGTDGSTLNIGGGGTLGSAAFTASTAYQASNNNLTSLAGLAYVSGTYFVKMTGANAFALDNSTYISSLSLTGDISGSGSASIATTIASGAVTLAKMANLAANSIIGNNTGVAATPLALTGTQVTAMLDTFSTTTTTKGLVSGSNGVGATYFLNANGTWSIPTGTATGSNTGDVTLATNSGLQFGSGQTLLAMGTPSSITTSSTNSVTTNTHTHAITPALGFIGNGSAQYQVPVTGATTFTPTWTTAINLYGASGLNALTYVSGTYFVKMTGANAFALDSATYEPSFTTLPISKGGTGSGTAPTAFGVIYASSTTAYASTSSNVTITKQFLSQTGNGTVSAAPVWGALVSGDIPNNAANTSGSAGSVSGTNVITNANLRQSAARSVIGNATNATANVADISTTTADQVLISTATTLTWGTVTTAAITNSAVTYAKIQNVAANTFLANATASAAAVQEIATTRIPLFASAITGTPSATTYLRGDGSWSTISGGTGTVTSVSVTTANGVSGTVATATTTPAITLTLGSITPTTVNGLTFTSAATGFTIAGGTTSKTLTVSNTLTFSGTDTSTLNIGSGGTLGSAAFTASTAYEPAITTLTAPKGGTGQGTYAIGDTLYASATNALSRLTVGAANTLLVSTGTIPSWSFIDMSSMPSQDLKKSVLVATTPNDSFVISSGAVTSISTGIVVDGVNPSVNSRILIKNAPTSTGAGTAQNSSNPANGIYVVTAVTTTIAVSRATDADVSADLRSAIVSVDAGTINGGKTFKTNFKTTDTINTTGVLFTEVVTAQSNPIGYFGSTTAQTLLASSAFNQVYTGATSITYTLPTTSVLAGSSYRIVNDSANNTIITVNTSSGTTITEIAKNGIAVFVAKQDAPTAITHWMVQHSGYIYQIEAGTATGSIGTAAYTLSTWTPKVNTLFNVYKRLTIRTIYRLGGSSTAATNFLFRAIYNSPTAVTLNQANIAMPILTAALTPFTTIEITLEMMFTSTTAVRSWMRIAGYIPTSLSPLASVYQVNTTQNIDGLSNNGTGTAKSSIVTSTAYAININVQASASTSITFTPELFDIQPY